jgi:hypothetical protein
LRRNRPINVYIEAHDEADDDEENNKQIVASEVVRRYSGRGAHVHMKHVNEIAIKFIYRK